MMRAWLREWLGIEHLVTRLCDLERAHPMDELTPPQAWISSDEDQAKAERTLRRRSFGNS